MTLNMLVEQTRDSILDIDAALGAMKARLDEILMMKTIVDRDFVEVGAIVNNVSYMLLYLEANAAYIFSNYIKSYRAALTEILNRDERLLRLLENLSCQDNECEVARRAFLNHLLNGRNHFDDATDHALTALQHELKRIFGCFLQDKTAFLKRLGTHVGEQQPDIIFYGLMRDSESELTRIKLDFAWEKLGYQYAQRMTALVDQMVELRRDACVSYVGQNVLRQTFQKCRVSEKESREYWEEVLVLSVIEHRKLEREIKESLGVKGGVKVNFARYLDAIRGGRLIPPIPLMRCIAYITAIAEKMFGISVKEVQGVAEHMMSFDISKDGCLFGRINFDLWDTGPVKRNNNATIGVRSRTDWCGIVQKPVAHVFCRFRKSEGVDSCITFQNAHSLFHEFGHALNHLFIKRRLPNLSGLEFLPLERIEILSMWFERWVYHNEFERFLSFSGSDIIGLETSRKIKILEYRRTHLDRALICALDFEVHGSTSENLEQCYDRIDGRFGVSRYCSLADVLEYFTQPMLMSNPGAYFAYLWGAGASASRFEPLMQKRLDDMPGPQETLTQFNDCFSYELPSIRPDPKAIFKFYDNLIAG